MKEKTDTSAWTSQEVETLTRHVGAGETYVEIAKAMGRSYTAVRIKAKRLGLSRPVIPADDTPPTAADKKRIAAIQAEEAAQEAENAAREARMPAETKSKSAPETKSKSAPETKSAPAPETKSAIHSNRETWLNHAVDLMRPLFELKGNALPEHVRVSCGFPSVRGLSAKKAVLGECWNGEAAEDKVAQIFINPRIKDPLFFEDVACGVIPTLAHELCHTVFAKGEKHGKNFRTLAKSIGLTGKMTATKGSDEFVEGAREWLKTLGEYPHAGLTDSMRPEKKQTTRLIKAECETCGYSVRVTRKWLEKGAPLCPCNHKGMAFELPEEEEAGDE